MKNNLILERTRGRHFCIHICVVAERVFFKKSSWQLIGNTDNVDGNSRLAELSDMHDAVPKNDQ